MTKTIQQEIKETEGKLDEIQILENQYLVTKNQKGIITIYEVISMLNKHILYPKK